LELNAVSKLAEGTMELSDEADAADEATEADFALIAADGGDDQ
jgi:hypothetical protein